MKINLPKISIDLILKLLLAVVILSELYLAYFSLFRNLDPQAQIVTSNNIIRVNRNAYQQASSFLDSLDEFIPVIPALTNSDPFNLKR